MVLYTLQCTFLSPTPTDKKHTFMFMILVELSCDCVENSQIILPIVQDMSGVCVNIPLFLYSTSISMYTRASYVLYNQTTVFLESVYNNIVQDQTTKGNITIANCDLLL